MYDSRHRFISPHRVFLRQDIFEGFVQEKDLQTVEVFSMGMWSNVMKEKMKKMVKKEMDKKPMKKEAKKKDMKKKDCY